MQALIIVSEYFNSTTATGKLHYASLQETSNSEEEWDLEADFVIAGALVDLNPKV